MDPLWEAIRHAFGAGIDPKSFTVAQVCLRALIIYLGGLFLLRIGDNRFVGKSTAFDIILGFILGSILSRGVNGSAALLPTLAAAAFLIFLHWLLAWTALHSRRFGLFVKGKPETLVRDGEILWDSMRRKAFSRGDLEESLRLHSNDDIGRVREARFERSGHISVLEKPKESRIVEIRVQEGVQTVRLEIGVA
jgi:uncharacterized membrane protein YcaP (DUF421 family)